MLDGDGETLDNASLTLAVNDKVNPATIHVAHGIVVEVRIILTTCNTILDVVDTRDVDGGIVYDTGTAVRLCVYLVSSVTCICVIFGNGQNVIVVPYGNG